MERGVTGAGKSSIAASETCRPFVPAPLPPDPPLAACQAFGLRAA